ncbi:MAG: hypothetical protein V7K67_30010 [Nostoc sp.]|uniref:hypothetical protein n=1 Tax=Nostoc sp. TaxID=1180 RepID=UPI002FF2BFBC
MKEETLRRICNYRDSPMMTLRRPQAIARIFTMVNKVKIYIRVKINGTIRIWQKGSYAHT